MVARRSAFHLPLRFVVCTHTTVLMVLAKPKLFRELTAGLAIVNQRGCFCTDGDFDHEV